MKHHVITERKGYKWWSLILFSFFNKFHVTQYKIIDPYENREGERWETCLRVMANQKKLHVMFSGRRRERYNDFITILKMQ